MNTDNIDNIFLITLGVAIFSSPELVSAGIPLGRIHPNNLHSEAGQPETCHTFAPA